MRCLLKNNPGSRIPNSGLKPKTVFLLFALMLITAGIQAALSYPARQEKYVNDFAGVLADTDRTTIGKMLENHTAVSGVSMVLVIVKSISDYGDENPDIYAFAKGLFNDWNTGAETGNRGVLILISTGDRKMKIETGSGFGPGYDETMLKIAEKTMIPFFKQGSYGRGIYEGIREIIRKTSGKPSFPEAGGAFIAAGAAGALFFILMLVLNARRGKSGKNAQEENTGRRGERAAPKAAKANKMPVKEEVFGGGAGGGW
jgi:uncharacterized membrane protein YgcG